MKLWKAALISLATGMVVTLYTGLINTTPGGGLVGATWFGWPASWLKRLVIAPQYYPYTITFGNLVLDIAIWTVVIFIVWNLVLSWMRNR